LQVKKHRWKGLELTSEVRPIEGVQSDLLDIRAEIAFNGAETAGIMIGDAPVRFDVTKQELTCGGTTAPSIMKSAFGAPGVVSLRILVDRGSIEVFANDGRVAISVGAIPAVETRLLK